MADGLDLFFPLAGPEFAVADPETRIGRVRCLPGDETHPVYVVGVKRSIEEVVRAVLATAREGDRGFSARPVTVRFLPTNLPLQGSSYQLALAVCDRLLRAGCKPTRRIFATGAIQIDGHGEVDGVEGLAAKIAAVAAVADPGDIFAFPAASRRDMSLEANEGLKALRERGVLVCPVSRLDELGFLWADTAQNGSFLEDMASHHLTISLKKLWLLGGLAILALWMIAASLL